MLSGRKQMSFIFITFLEENDFFWMLCPINILFALLEADRHFAGIYQEFLVSEKPTLT